MTEAPIEFVVRMRGTGEAVEDARRVQGAVRSMGGEVRRVGEQSNIASRGTGTLGGSVKRLAGAFIALGAGYKAYSAAKTAISYTRELAESSSILSKATGLTIEQSSRYVGVSGALGVSSGQLNVAFKSLATQVEKGGRVTGVSAAESRKHVIAKLNEKLAIEGLDKRLAKGTITQQEYANRTMKARLQAEASGVTAGKTKTAFDKLGISQGWLTRHGKNFNDVIFMVTKKLGQMQPSTKKLKIESELFGRSWAALNPLLGEGSEHLEKVLGMAKKFGVELHGGVNKELEQLREAQLESTLASDGLRIAFTKTAAGPMLSLLKGFANLKNAVRTQNWPLFNKELGKALDVAGHVIETFEVRSIEGFGQLAPKLLKALWRGFQHASLPNQALMLGIIASKLGLTGPLFSALGKRLGRRLAGGVIASEGEAAVAGTTLGGVFGKAFAAAAAGYLIYNNLLKGNPTEPEPLGEAFDWLTGDKNKRQKAEARQGAAEEHRYEKKLRHSENAAERRRKGELRHAEHLGPVGKARAQGKREAENEVARMHGLASGGTVMSAGLALVGERGPEVVNLPQSAQVSPLQPGSLAPIIENVVVLDGRVLSRSVRRQTLQSQAAGA